MSGQGYGGQKGGQQGMEQPGRWAQNQQQGSAMPAYLPGSPGDYGGSYFSMGGSSRSPFGSISGPFNPNQYAGPPATATPLDTNQFSRGGFSGFGNLPTGTPDTSGNPFSRASGSFGNNGQGGAGMGSSANQPAPQYQPTYSSNNDPNSPEYAAQYWGYAPSTRGYMMAPGSQQANQAYQDFLASQRDPNQAHF